MLYTFFWVILRYLPASEDESVPKRRHIKFRRRGITQKKAYNTLKNPISSRIKCLQSFESGKTARRNLSQENISGSSVRRPSKTNVTKDAFYYRADHPALHAVLHCSVQVFAFHHNKPCLRWDLSHFCSLQTKFYWHRSLIIPDKPIDLPVHLNTCHCGWLHSIHVIYNVTSPPFDSCHPFVKSSLP